MENSKHFRKLPDRSKAIILEYKGDRDKTKLFKKINEDIATQNTISSRGTRRSSYRGILRKWFKLTNEEMLPIKASTTEMKAYFERGQRSARDMTEDRLNKVIIESLLKIDICNLLIRSGLRISELLENKYKLTKKTIKFRLNKKRDLDYYRIHIIGDFDDWIKRFKALRDRITSPDDIRSIIDKLNRDLKTILDESFRKRSSHICRAIYIRLIYENKDAKPWARWTLPRIIKHFIHHENLQSTGYYESVIFDEPINIDIK